jgi:hypothetical protein
MVRMRPWWLAFVAAALAAAGIAAVGPSAASLSSPALVWTKQAPATSPPARGYAAMAYDRATGTEVLFPGWSGTTQALAATWTWG